MRIKAFRTYGRRGIVRSCQFGNGPLPNLILNIHLSRKSFCTVGMSRIRVPV